MVAEGVNRGELAAGSDFENRAAAGAYIARAVVSAHECHAIEAAIEPLNQWLLGLVAVGTSRLGTECVQVRLMIGCRDFEEDAAALVGGRAICPIAAPLSCSIEKLVRRLY